MRSKRRASSPISTNSFPATSPRRKKRKANYTVYSSDDEDYNKDELQDLEEDEWFINCILDETDSQYLIDWEGPWSPSWEPKAHANEAAKKAWEKKKSELALKDVDSTESLLTQAHSPQLTEKHKECPEFIPESQEYSNSQLFVPLDTISTPSEVSENTRILSQSIGVRGKGSELPGTGGEFSLQRDESPLPEAHNITCFFEYTPKGFIPPEYRLAGEFEEELRPVAPKPACEKDPFDPETISLSLDGTASNKLTGREERKRYSQGGTQDEIPETPEIISSTFSSQSSQVHPEVKKHISQAVTTSFSPSSSLTPRAYLFNDCPAGGTTIACRASSVAESGYLTISQNLISHSTIRSATMEGQSPRREVLSLAETMEKYSHIEGSTPREKIRNAYAKLREKNAAETLQNDPSATPSSVGDIEPSAPVTVPDTVAPLSVRIDKDSSHHLNTDMRPPAEPIIESGELPEPDVQTIQPSALTVSHVEQMSPGSIHLGPAEFAVPLPMDSRVKDDYKRVFTSETQNILGLISNSNALEISDDEQEQHRVKIQEALERLRNVTTHPDLNISQHIRAVGSDLEKEASWADYSSAKFLLLGYLIEAAHSHDIHLVITVNGEEAQKIIESYFTGKGLNYTRPREEMGSGTNVEISMIKGSLSFGIQSVHNGVMETYKPPSAIIALDSALNTKSPSVQHMRTTYARNGNLLPVIRLLVANSSEHIELCFPGPATFQRLLLLIRQSYRLRDIVGDLQDDALGVHEDAEEILACLLSDNFCTHWSLPQVEPLRDIDAHNLVLFEPQNESGVNSPAPSNPAIQKRLLVDDDSEPASKRPRMDESQATSQLTELSDAPSQTLDKKLHMLEKSLVQMRNSHAVDLERLQKALASTQSRLQEREKILDSLQHRYETRTNDLHKIRQERDQLAENKISSDQRLEKQRDDISKLKDERTQLRRDLEQAREVLKSSGGHTAELENAREEIRRLTKENASLERKAEYERKQAEYIREQYQTASNVAAQSGNEARQLREENESLKRKVEGNATRLREINTKNDEARHLTRVTELEAILASREELLRRKEDELREIRKNRPSTRSTSTQPRSPKWTAGSRPTSPGINNGSSFHGRGSALRFSSEMSL